MLYKCKESFLVELCDDDGFMIENEFMKIEKGSIWTADGRSYESNSHIRLDRKENDKLEWLEMPKECIESCFEPVICSYCKNNISEDDVLVEILVDNKKYHFHKDCDYVPLDHLLDVVVGNSK